MDEHNIARRHLKPVGKSLGMPWLSWHCFRRTHTTLANELGIAFTDRMAMMGHSEARMMALYTAEDLDRRRTVLDQMAERLLLSPSFLETATRAEIILSAGADAVKCNGQNGR